MGPNTGLISIRENPEMKTMMAQEIKADVRLFTDAGAKIANMIVKAYKPFIEEYIAHYEATSGKGGSDLSGNAFAKMLDKWEQADPQRAKELNQLHQNIYQIMIDLQTKDLEPLDKENTVPKNRINL